MDREKKSLAEMAEEVEAAAKSRDKDFSVKKWFEEIGTIRSISFVYEGSGLPAGYVVFWDTEPTPIGRTRGDEWLDEPDVRLNTDIGYLYSKDEDVELSRGAIGLIERGIDLEFTRPPLLFSLCFN